MNLVSPAGSISGTETFAAFVVLCIYLLRILALAPLAVAIHRFVLLGERPLLLPLTPVGRHLRFGGWLIAVSLLSDISGLYRPPAQATLLSTAMLLGIASVTMILGARLVLMFPAIALEADTHPISLSWGMTRWQFWRVTAVFIVTFVPLGILLPVVLLTMRQVLSPSTLGALIELPVLLPLFSAFYTVLAASTASWLFISYDLNAKSTDGAEAVVV